MKGVLFYDAALAVRPWRCNMCGRKHNDFKAWVYREGDILLLFCGKTTDCRDEFLGLNKLQDVEGDDD